MAPSGSRRARGVAGQQDRPLCRSRTGWSDVGADLDQLDESTVFRRKQELRIDALDL
jgi:hypothetical protein